MPFIPYSTKKIGPERLLIIDQANKILDEYAAQGFDMTLRQIYYKFIARDLFPDDRTWRRLPNNKWKRDSNGTKNADPNYKWLGDIISDGRMCGLIDWEQIEDRTRNLKSRASWDTTYEMLDTAFRMFHRSRWENQPYRLEVWCFPPETPVVTASGVTPIADVQVGEKVLTHTGEFEHVTESIHHEHSGQLIEVKATGLLPIRCTPNHKFWVVPHDTSRPGFKGKDRKYGDPCWKEAKDLNKFDMLTIPQTSIVKDRTQMFMYGGPRSTNLGFVDLDNDLLRLVGHYLAEGNVMLDGRTVQFTFGGHEQDHAEFVERYAHSLGLSSHTYVEKSTVVVYVFGKALAKWFVEEFGCGAYNKRLPEWFMSLPHEKQMLTIYYHFLGDGTLNDKTRSALLVSTRSECLARQEQIVLLRCGYLAGVISFNDHDAPMFRVGISGESGQLLADKWGLELAARSRRYNHMRMSAQTTMFPVCSTETRDFKGTVYNLEVEHDHSYCVPVAVHNCEKEALIGIFASVCAKWDVPYFACRGYVSLSEAWVAAQRLRGYVDDGQEPIILHFGDHDPSGVDMTRDIIARFEKFGVSMDLKRMALNMDQVQKFKPPPNPAKLTDSRAKMYITKFGYQSWELDALEPSMLISLVEDVVEEVRDEDMWNEVIDREVEDRAHLRTLREQWAGIDKKLDKKILEMSRTIVGKERKYADERSM